MNNNSQQGERDPLAFWLECGDILNDYVFAKKVNRHLIKDHLKKSRFFRTTYNAETDFYKCMLDFNRYLTNPPFQG